MVLIIGILAAIAFPQYQVAVLKTRYSQLMIMGDAIRRAQDAYYLVHGKYSLKINDLDITIPGDCPLSDSGGTIYCPNFYCTVNDGSGKVDNGYVYCRVNSQGASIYYQIANLRKSTIRRCFTSPTEIGKKVCESFGGRSPYVNSSNGYWYYIL